MPHTRCLERLEIAAEEASGGAPTVLSTAEARGHLHMLMRRAVAPELVLALGWQAGGAPRRRGSNFERRQGLAPLPQFVCSSPPIPFLAQTARCGITTWCGTRPPGGSATRTGE